MMTSAIGVALFGLGRAGNIHLMNLCKNYRCQVLYVVEMEVNRATEVVDKYHMTNTTVIGPDEAGRVYADQGVKAVVVCTPTFAHEEIVEKALQNGKAVFCEKPISEDTEGTNNCYEAAESAGLPLLCSFNRRFDPSLRTLRQRVKSGEVGNVHVVKTCARDHPLPPIAYLKISGGLFHDCAVHDIDLVCWILREYPCAVFATGHAHDKQIAEMNDVDTTIITLTFSSGVMAVIDLSRHASYGYDQRCEVFGGSGMIVCENQYPLSVHKYDKVGAHTDPLKHSFPQRYADSYWEAMEHFFNVIQGKDVIEIDKLNTLNVSKIASACEESIKTGGVVKLNLQQPSQM